MALFQGLVSEAGVVQLFGQWSYASHMHSIWFPIPHGTTRSDYQGICEVLSVRCFSPTAREITEVLNQNQEAVEKSYYRSHITMYLNRNKLKGNPGQERRSV